MTKLNSVGLRFAAQFLGYSESGLRKLLATGRGPRYTRAGGRGHFKFPIEWLQEFQEQGAPAATTKRKSRSRVEPACKVDRELLNL